MYSTALVHHFNYELSQKKNICIYISPELPTFLVDSNLKGRCSFPDHKAKIAPCKGIRDSVGFWIPCCGFRIPGTGFRIPAQWIPDSKKSWIPFCCPVLMLFFALRFRVRILLY